MEHPRGQSGVLPWRSQRREQCRPRPRPRVPGTGTGRAPHHKVLPGVLTFIAKWARLPGTPRPARGTSHPPLRLTDTCRTVKGERRARGRRNIPLDARLPEVIRDAASAPSHTILAFARRDPDPGNVAIAAGPAVVRAGPPHLPRAGPFGTPKATGKNTKDMVRLRVILRGPHDSPLSTVSRKPTPVP